MAPRKEKRQALDGTQASRLAEGATADSFDPPAPPVSGGVFPQSTVGDHRSVPWTSVQAGEAPNDHDDIQIEPVVEDKEEETDDETIAQAAHLKRLSGFEQEIQTLEAEKLQLAEQVAEKDRGIRIQDMVRQAEARRNALYREVEALQNGAEPNAMAGPPPIHVPPTANPVPIDDTSLLSPELQQHPWPLNYKPRIPPYDGQSNPRKFLTAYETTVFSAGGSCKIVHSRG